MLLFLEHFLFYFHDGAKKITLVYGAILRAPAMDEVRTYADEEMLGWHVLVGEVLDHVILCEKKCEMLHVELTTFLKEIGENKDEFL